MGSISKDLDVDRLSGINDLLPVYRSNDAATYTLRYRLDHGTLDFRVALGASAIRS
jgi:hypothetical protein